MDQHEYKRIIENYIIPLLANNNGKLILQQDGAPCHTAKMIKKFFSDHEIELLDWTAQSPDLNPIEHIWAIIKRILGNKKFENFDTLKTEIIRILKEEFSPDYEHAK